MSQNPYISNDFTRYRYFEYPTDFKAVTRDRKYADGTPAFNKVSNKAPKKWQLVYEFDLEVPGEADELEIFDAHFESCDFTTPFEFLTKKYGMLDNVYYLDYEPSHEGNLSLQQTRTIILIKYDFMRPAPATKPTVPSGVAAIPYSTSPTDTVFVSWLASIPFTGRTIAHYRIKLSGFLISDIVTDLNRLIGSLDPDKNYTVSVAAVDSTGEMSAFSTPVPVKTLAVIGTPVNQKPTAANVTTSGIRTVGQTLTGSYVYSDVDGDAEAASVYEWRRANTSGGAGEATIAGANGLTYDLQAADVGKFIRFGVTPVSTVAPTTGTRVFSAYGAAIAAFTPSAPTNGQVNDTDNLFTFDVPTGVSLSDLEYSVNNTAFATVTQNPIQVGNIAIPAGSLKVRVAADASLGRGFSASLTNAVPFTVTDGGGTGGTGGFISPDADGFLQTDLSGFLITG